MFGCQQNLVADNREILEFICSEANKLSNCGIYLSRQTWFKTRKIVDKYRLKSELKSNIHFSTLCAQAAQETLISVAESFKSYVGLLKAFKSGKIKDRPQIPNYRKDGLAVVTYPAQAVKLKDGALRFPLGRQVKAWFGIDSFTLPMPTNLDYKTIREYRILPRNGCFYLELIYKRQPVKADVDPDKCLGIDHGLNNWLTCVSNVGTSFIVDGRHVKALNQWYNKSVATLKEGQSQDFWSKRLSRLTEKRNRQMRDAVNKAARIVINHCLKNRIGTVVFGWNTGQKDGANMGKLNNQKFVQIPTARLKARIADLCEFYGIRFIETEESYTSKTSFVDGDLLPKFGEKPEQWKSSGKRVKRGLFRTAANWYINADCNGSANILRKVAMMLELNLSGISRGALTAPLRRKLWTQESPSL